MQLWLILVCVFVVLAIVGIILNKDSGHWFDFTPIIHMMIVGLAIIAILLVYISHLKGCLNQQIVTTMSIEQAEILPVDKESL